MKFKSIFNKIFYYLIFPLVSLSFLLTPFNSDIRVYMGVEYIADKYYPFPQGFDLAWEIKPIGNRIINWVLMKAAEVVTPIDNLFWFTVIVKGIALAAAIVVCWYLSKQIRIWYAFPILFLSLTAIANIAVMQPEWWATVFGMLAIALLLQENKYYAYIAGLLFVLIGLFKGITVFMFIPVICAALLLKPEIRLQYKYIVAGITTGAIIFFILNATTWVHMLSDMLASGTIAHVGYYSWTFLLWYSIQWWFFYSPCFPIVFLTAFLVPAFILVLWFRKEYRKLMLFLVMWAVSFGMVVVQSEYMIYQYYVLTIPAVTTLFMWERL